MKTNVIFLALICLILGPVSIFSQNTVGVVTYDDSLVSSGYNLFFPARQGNVYLLNNCGEVVHQWIDSVYGPGNSSYLAEDGRLYRTGSRGQAVNPAFQSGGAGEVVQIKTWGDSLVWEYQVSDSLQRMHHDIYPMPNGNVLVIAWEKISGEDAIQLGRNPALLADGELWPEKVLELKPSGDSDVEIVWEWHAIDHVIQEYDSTKPNFGVVADHPELIDLNYDTRDGNADWLHANSIDYNPTLDQVLLSIPGTNEIWIIDHSTTTQQAASHNGGVSGKGGDLIFRWGNPQAYQRGDSADQKFFFQHDAHWMNIGLSPSDPDRNRIMVFNNRFGGDYSAVEVIEPIYEFYNGEYLQLPGGTFAPSGSYWSYSAPTPTDLFSSGLSGAQRLANGNTLVCAGRQGWMFELDAQTENIVWEYINPLVQGVPVVQGDPVVAASNSIFRLNRYPVTYSAFSGKDLAPQGYLEINPDTTICEINMVASEEEITRSHFDFYPNPAHSEIVIDNFSGKKETVTIYDLNGRQIQTAELIPGKNNLSIRGISQGIYFLKIGNQSMGKLSVL